MFFHELELANYEQNSNSNRFKYNAYRRAANILNQYQIEIKSGEQAKNLVRFMIYFIKTNFKFLFLI